MKKQFGKTLTVTKHSVMELSESAMAGMVGGSHNTQCYVTDYTLCEQWGPQCSPETATDTCAGDTCHFSC